MQEREIAVAEGDGVGAEIMAVTLRALDALGVPLRPVRVDIGERARERGHPDSLSPEAREAVGRTGVLLKGPLATPPGGACLDVALRRRWSAYAAKRVYRTLPGVATPRGFRRPIDVTVIRETLEDTYGGLEHMPTAGVAQSRRIVTRAGSERLHRCAFEVARRKGARRVTCGHKASVMRLTDGLFRDTFHEVAEAYPTLEADDLPVDELAMRLVMEPQAFDVLVLPNLQGDIIADLCAGLVGGSGYVAAASVGERAQIFEVLHGPAPDRVGRDMADPSALILTSAVMLRHLGLAGAAARLERALFDTLVDMTRVPDLGSPPPRFRTSRFEAELLGRIEATPPGDDARAEAWGPAPCSPPERRAGTEDLVGVDFFVASELTPAQLAARLADLGDTVPLRAILNRGVQVWPVAYADGDCVDQHCVRFEASGPVRAAQLLAIASAVSERVEVRSLEMLVERDGTKAYQASVTV